MTTHKANPNSSYSAQYQHTALCQTRGTVGGSGSGSVFRIAKADTEVTCKRCLKVMTAKAVQS